MEKPAEHLETEVGEEVTGLDQGPTEAASLNGTAALLAELSDDQGPFRFTDIWPAIAGESGAIIGLLNLKPAVRRHPLFSQAEPLTEAAPEVYAAGDVLPWGESVLWTLASVEPLLPALALFGKLETCTVGIPEFVGISEAEIVTALSRARSCHGHELIARLTHDCDYFVLLGPREVVLKAHQRLSGRGESVTPQKYDEQDADRAAQLATPARRSSG